ncbi:TIGR03643 family protein [Vibrio lentus]
MKLTKENESRIIEMAWEDRTPFEAIELQFGFNESEVIRFMRSHLKLGSFKLWRTRVSGRSTKHAKIRRSDVSRGYCPTQYKHR